MCRIWGCYEIKYFGKQEPEQSLNAKREGNTAQSIDRKVPFAGIPPYLGFSSENSGNASRQNMR